MMLQRVIIGVIAIALSAFKAGAQDKSNPLKLEAPVFYTIKGSGDIRLYIDKNKVKKGSKISAELFAQNNVRKIPMQLQYKGAALSIRLLAPAKNSNLNLAFLAKLNDILYVERGASGYNWIWKGRAKAPASPIVAKENVNNIKWWVVATIDSQVYTSDTITTHIKP